MIYLPKKKTSERLGGISGAKAGPLPPLPPASGQEPANASSSEKKASSSSPKAAPIKKQSPSSSQADQAAIASPPSSLEPSGAGAPSLTSDVSALALQSNPAGAPKTDQLWLTRKEAAAFLKARGFPITLNRLAKYAVTGDGPDYRHWCGHVLYDRDTALAWAWSLLASPDTIKPKAGKPG